MKDASMFIHFVFIALISLGCSTSVHGMENQPESTTPTQSHDEAYNRSNTVMPPTHTRSLKRKLDLDSISMQKRHKSTAPEQYQNETQDSLKVVTSQNPALAMPAHNNNEMVIFRNKKTGDTHTYPRRLAPDWLIKEFRRYGLHVTIRKNTQ